MRAEQERAMIASPDETRGELTAVVVSLALLKGGGGPTKTIASFREALEADLFSFANSSTMDEKTPAVAGAELVRTSRLPVLRQWRWAWPKERREAEKAAASADILSCHSFFRYHALWVEKMHRHHGTPYWFVPHGILDPWVQRKNALAKQAFLRMGGKRFLDSASTLIFSTEAERDKAASIFSFRNAEVVPWPVEPVCLSGRERARTAVRDRLGIPPDARVLLYFGRLHSMKQPLETIRAVASAACSQLHLIIVGNEQDVLERDCVEKARSEGIGDRVHVVGPAYGDGKYDYMHASDAYISLSHRENFNHTAAESLAAGLPVVLSPGNDLNSLLGGVGCSVALKENSIAAAGSVITDIGSQDDKVLRKMGERGRRWVIDHLDFEVFRARLQAIGKKYGRK